MQIQAGVPAELVGVLQATILFFLVAGPVIKRIFRLKGAKTGLEDATQTFTSDLRRGGDDPLMDQFLYGIPILGLVFQLIGYLIAIAADHRARSSCRRRCPIAFAALCGVMCERSGVVNIGIEGTMLVAAFVGWTAGVYLAPVLGSTIRAGLRRHADAARRAWSWRSWPGSSCRSSTPGYRSRSRPTRSSAARSSTSPRSGSPATSSRCCRSELARGRRPVQGVRTRPKA